MRSFFCMIFKVLLFIGEVAALMVKIKPIEEAEKEGEAKDE